FFLLCGNNRITLGIRLFHLLPQTVGQQCTFWWVFCFCQILIFVLSLAMALLPTAGDFNDLFNIKVS
ncbi:hypothetical protein, partial [Thalassolituus marinus]|uniref:hypothetical protein n=1 Tax=Thalassolituus marinus TaxID=671053 RepID=UPI001CE2F5F6